jgi:hypothetical protein
VFSVIHLTCSCLRCSSFSCYRRSGFSVDQRSPADFLRTKFVIDPGLFAWQIKTPGYMQWEDFLDRSLTRGTKIWAIRGCLCKSIKGRWDPWRRGMGANLTKSVTGKNLSRSSVFGLTPLQSPDAGDTWNLFCIMGLLPTDLQVCYEDQRKE